MHRTLTFIFNGVVCPDPDIRNISLPGRWILAIISYLAVIDNENISFKYKLSTTEQDK